MPTRLIYVMDPMCSWCWGFAPVVQSLAEQARQAGVELVVRVGGLRREQAVLDEASRVRILGHWQAVNASTGQLFNFVEGMPAGMVYDTEPACRALVAAGQVSADKIWPLALLIQQAFYCEGIDVTKASELRRLAEQTGLCSHAFATAFDSPAAYEATQADFVWVENLGIAGFPTLLAQRQGRTALLTNGYQPLATLEPLLARWLEQPAHA